MALLPSGASGSRHVAGMPGDFFCLGCHRSQHRDAVAEVEEFVPPWCKCTTPGCDRMVRWETAMSMARAITQESARELAREMPTEWARQSHLRDGLCAPFATHRDLVERLFLGYQHGFCQSVGGNTAASHGGDADNNHHQYNYLEFSAPSYQADQMAAARASNKRYDVGVWAFEHGELFVRLSARLRLFFNSQRTHQVLPSESLLPFACDPDELRRHATRFVAMRTAEALEAVRCKPALLLSFSTDEDAAAFQCSLVGTTTFQQGQVTNLLMKAMKANTVSAALRGFVPKLSASQEPVGGGGSGAGGQCREVWEEVK